MTSFYAMGQDKEESSYERVKLCQTNEDFFRISTSLSHSVAKHGYLSKHTKLCHLAQKETCEWNVVMRNVKHMCRQNVSRRCKTHVHDCRRGGQVSGVKCKINVPAIVGIYTHYTRDKMQ